MPDDLTTARRDLEPLPFDNPALDIRVRWDDISLDAKASSHLPFLGKKQVIWNDSIHLLAAHAKTGKTVLLLHMIREWRNTFGEHCPRVLWITEEFENVWAKRKSDPEFASMPVTLIYGMRYPSDQLLQEACTGNEEVVIIDTVRPLMRVNNENDNNEVSKVLGHWITSFQFYGKTVILVHHLRKGEGEYGVGVAGATAWRAMVDVILEVHHVDEYPERRRVNVSSRLDTTPDIYYELKDGLLIRLTDIEKFNRRETVSTGSEYYRAVGDE